MRLLLPALLALLSASAQSPDSARPQFAWQGDVDDVVTLYIRAGADKLQTETRQGAPPEHQRYRFFDPLPDTRQEVRLTVLEGRGSVRITQQPTLDNNYTVAVTIQDRQDGIGHYSLALYWDASDARQIYRRWRDHGWQGDGIAPGKPPAEQTGRVTWRGHVDGDALVECRASSCSSAAQQGLPVDHARFRFTAPLPEREVAVRLDEPSDNDDVRLTEQPSAANGWAARVRITDGCGGARLCGFTLSWPLPGAADDKQLPASPGARWSGRVTGTVRVTLRGSSALTDGSVAGQETSFSVAVPHRSDLPYSIRKIQGAGEVRIVETPSEKNGYSLVFEIANGSGPPGDYVVEVRW